MAKTKTRFFCKECGNDTPRWQGQCPSCHAWNTLAEETVVTGKNAKRSAGISVHGAGILPSKPVVLEEVDGNDVDRYSSEINELDMVLGGGVVPGSIILLGGEPGIGKSTLTLQLAGLLHTLGRSVLIASGEESATQVKMRAQRLGKGATKVHYLGEVNVDEVIRQAMELKPSILIVDSIQTVYSEDLEGAPGNVGQVRECAARLQRYAKSTGVTVIIIGQVTKDGGVAGPKTLEHIVDTVLYFEQAGDQDTRILRSTKNRFGGIDEIAVFRMTGQGLEVVSNPSELFLSQRRAGAPGSAVVPITQGARPLLVEIQGLASRAAYGTPQRVSRGFDQKRMALLLAVLEKKLGFPFRMYDVFLNVVGGLRVEETGADLAVAVALASSMVERAVPGNAIFLGEIGLGGEVRAVAQAERRIIEAARMGFEIAYLPTNSIPKSVPEGIRVVGVEDVAELLNTVIGPILIDELEEGEGWGGGGGSRENGKKAQSNGRRTEMVFE